MYCSFPQSFLSSPPSHLPIYILTLHLSTYLSFMLTFSTYCSLPKSFLSSSSSPFTYYLFLTNFLPIYESIPHAYLQKPFTLPSVSSPFLSLLSLSHLPLPTTCSLLTFYLSIYLACLPPIPTALSLLPSSSSLTLSQSPLLWQPRRALCQSPISPPERCCVREF